jgi:hypothetical protein
MNGASISPSPLKQPTLKDGLEHHIRFHIHFTSPLKPLMNMVLLWGRWRYRLIGEKVVDNTFDDKPDKPAW